MAEREKEKKPEAKVAEAGSGENLAAPAAPAAEKTAPSKVLERSSAVPRLVCNRLASRFEGPPIARLARHGLCSTACAPSRPPVLQLSGLQARRGFSLRLGWRSFFAHVLRPRGGGC